METSLAAYYRRQHTFPKLHIDPISNLVIRELRVLPFTFFFCPVPPRLRTFQPPSISLVGAGGWKATLGRQARQDRANQSPNRSFAYLSRRIPKCREFR